MKKSKDYKPDKNEFETRKVEIIESGPTRKPGAFVPEPDMIYEKPKGGETNEKM